MSARKLSDSSKCMIGYDNLTYRRLLIFLTVNHQNVVIVENNFALREHLVLEVHLEADNKLEKNVQRTNYLCLLGEVVAQKEANQEKKKSAVTTLCFLHEYNNYVANDLLALRGIYYLYDLLI